MEPAATALTPSRKIGVLLIVDTRYIKHNHPRRQSPSGLVIVNSEHVFVVGAAVQSGDGKVKLRARSGDVISIAGTSADHNSSDAVIVYKVLSAPHGKVLGHFDQNMVTRSGAVEPDPDAASRDGLPAIETMANFSSFESKIRSHGTDRVRVEFALYSLSAQGQEQILVGYYGCDLIFTVI